MPEGSDSNTSGLHMGRYELLDELGQGGMARVYRARVAGPKGFEKMLVVKLIQPQLADDPQFNDLFLQEAKLAAQLNHPNIVQIFDFGEEGGIYFLAMEHVDGPNLRSLMRRAHSLLQFLPLHHAVRIVSQVCEALAYAHEFRNPSTGAPLNIIHRDVSSDNILVSRTGAVKVVDFGIAKANSQLHQTRVGVVKGKVPYMAPEQLRNEPLDLRIDVYALGVVLYEMATGRKPHEANSEVALIHAILHEPIVPAATRRPDLPPALLRIIETALSKDRAQRYASCREFQVDLESFLASSGQQIGSLQLAEMVATVAPPTSGGSHSGVSLPGSRPGRRSISGGVSTSGSRPGSKETSSPRTHSSQSGMVVTGQGKHVSRELIAVGIAAALLFVGGGAFLLGQRPPEGPAPVATRAGLKPIKAQAAEVAPPVAQPPPPTPAPDASTQVVAAPEEIQLQVKVAPLEAVLKVDGVQLLGNPYTGKFPRDGKTHVLEATAAGFETHARQVSFESNLVLELALEKLKPTRTRTPSTTKLGTGSRTRRSPDKDSTGDN